MREEILKKLNMNLPRLGFGGMRLPCDSNGKPDQAQVNEMVHYAMKNGINYFDTAYFYHDELSEPVLAEALKPYPRESYYITDKLPYFLWDRLSSIEEIRKIFEIQLKRCRTNYFDFYFFHAFNNDRFEESKKYDTYAFFKEMQKAGKINKIGFSFHSSPEVLTKILDEFEWDAVQLQINYYDWDFQNLKESYRILTERGIPCFVMEPLRGGMLTNLEIVNEIFGKVRPEMSAAAWGIRWVASLPNVAVVNSGMSNMEQLTDNVSYMREDSFQPMTKTEYKTVDEVIEAINRMGAIPCTGCNYCNKCPKKIAIPKIFSIYNDYKRNEANDLNRKNEDYMTKIAYHRFVPDDKMAHLCINCGICEKNCPQHIAIPELLKEFSNLFYDASFSK